MALTDGDRRELERIAAGDGGDFGARGRVQSLQRFGAPDSSDQALLARAAKKLDEKAGA